MSKPKAKVTKIGVVREVIQEHDRTLLYTSEDYHVIAGKDVGVNVGDTIEYEPYGFNFGWFVRRIEG